MLGYITEFDRTFANTFANVDQLRRRMERVFGDVDAGALAPATSWPRTSVFDSGKALVLVADVPGLKDKDIEVTFKEDVLTIAGERKVPVPEGYTVHRQERRGARFSRSFTVPFKVDADNLTAELKDGVLTINLPKTPEAQPRKITVKVGQ